MALACAGAVLCPGGPASAREGVLRQAMLDAHNAVRARVGVAPLRWDERLAADAQAYADELARTGRFVHAAQPPERPPEGENLWAGTSGAFGLGEMADAWTDERRDFVNRPAPQFSRAGAWQGVGHYTQMIWRTTTALGCALATGARVDYLVCRYAPAGNVIGWRAY